MPSPRQHLEQPRAGLFLRSGTALLGGYAATAALVTLLARCLPGDRAEATVWGMIVSPLVYVSLALWAFHERRLARVFVAIWGGALLCGGMVWVLGVRP